jgi:L-alanine-DL-glutamate epimerase-like enolase superfamily enzyme
MQIVGWPRRGPNQLGPGLSEDWLMADERVEKIETFRLHGEFVVIKVSGGGQSGWGEGFATAGGATADMMRHVALEVIGRSPFDVADISQHLFRRGYRIGHSGAYIAAMSAVDIALHDLQGQLLGVPVWQLLGGRMRPAVEVYASLMRSTRSPAEEADLVRKRMDQGYRSIKLHTGLTWGVSEDEDNTTRVVEAVRAGAGDQVRILVDVNQAFTVPQASAVGVRLGDLGVAHFEEPIMPWDFDGYAFLRSRLPMPLAAGEQAHNFAEFRDLLTRGCLDIVQPNITACGGYTVARKVAALAEAFNRQVVCHMIEPTLGTAASLHFWLSTPACELPQEYFGEPVHPLRDHTPILKRPPSVRDGRLAAPEGPGLGVEIDEDALRRATTSYTVYDAAT